MSEEKYKKAARVVVKAGFIPFPINDTFIDILKLLTNEEELEFIMAFRRKASQTMEELKKSSKMSEEEILRHVESLAKKGLIFNQPSSSGVMVYRLLPLIMIGVFEYTFMKKLEYSEKEKKIAALFAKLLNELRDFVQDQYDTVVPMFKSWPPIDRTIPILDKNIEGKEIQIAINEEVEVPTEQILPTFKIEELIEKFDEIAVAHCFCRHHKDLLGDPCKLNAPRENCFTFGKSARHVVNHGFGRMVSKEEALKIMKEAEEFGLVHKAFHPNSDINRDETSVCNCCSCCCGTLEFWRNGTLSMINSTNFLSSVNQDLCVGCGTCVEKCPVEAMSLNDNDKAEVNEMYCIGCGICVHFCPENAISLLEGMRKVYVPPPKFQN